MAKLKDVDVESHGTGVALVVFSGAHNVATSARIWDLFEGLIQENELVVADFCSARFIDLSMLRVAFAAEKRASELGKDFRVQLPTQ